MKVFPRMVYVFLALFFISGCSGGAPETKGRITIVENGEPKAVIVVDREAYTTDGRLQNPLDHPRGFHQRNYYKYPSQLKNAEESLAWDVSVSFTPGSINEAAGVLALKIKESTGAEIPVVYETPSEGAVIYLGASAAAERFGIDQPGMDEDGFEILFPDERSIVIIGPGKSGTEYGVYEFLERYVGVRWLMPGEYGTDVPKLKSISVPRENIRSEPAFYSRRMTGAGSLTEWYRRLRRHQRVAQAHNLYVLFWTGDYLESHPHFYPVDESGNPMPGPGTNHSWNPCFNAEGIVEEAAAVITEFFDLNPHEETFNLCINDSTNFCRCPECSAEITGEKNSLGITDYSAPYFRWASEVAEIVAKKYPDKRLVTIAYQNTFDAPDEKLHPNVIVFITYDGMKMAAPEVRRKMEEALEAWNEKAEVLGWYDYIYGRHYMLPRVYPKFMAEYYKLLYENGVRVINSNTAPNIGEGPKLYAAAKLKWDPYLDIEKLLDEWYSRCAGEEGGRYLKKYYDFWEEFWTERILETEWGRNFTWSSPGGGFGTFLPFRHGAPGGEPTYLLDVIDEEMLVLREWMENALEMTKTEPQRRRVEVLYNAFEYYEATRLLYKAGRVEFEKAEEIAELFPEWVNAALKRERLLERVFPGIPGLEEVVYNPGDMPFKGTEHLVRILWENRDLIYASENASNRILSQAKASGNDMLAETAERISRLGQSQEIDEEALLEGIVFHLRLDEGGGGMAHDTSGNENHGAVRMCEWVQDSPGGGGYSLKFSENSSVSCSHDESLSVEDEITVSVWIKLEEYDSGGWSWMLRKATSGHDANYGLLLSGTHGGSRPHDAGRIQLSANAGGSWGQITPAYNLKEGVWQHVAGVYHKEDGGQLYIDGMAVSPERTGGRGKMCLNEAPLSIMLKGGMLSDIRIYDRALSGEEVAALYEAGRR